MTRSQLLNFRYLMLYRTNHQYGFYEWDISHGDGDWSRAVFDANKTSDRLSTTNSGTVIDPQH